MQRGWQGETAIESSAFDQKENGEEAELLTTLLLIEQPPGMEDS